MANTRVPKHGVQIAPAPPVEQVEQVDTSGGVLKVSGRLMLEDLLPGPENAAARAEIIDKGVYTQKQGEKVRELKVAVAKDGDLHRVVAIGAVTRDPGLTQQYIDLVQDWLPNATATRTRIIAQLWQIYFNEGIINNAVNKIAAILSGGGRYKVRFTKKGKKQKAIDELQEILDEFRRYVNNSPLDGVVKGDRGLQMVTHQAVRAALVEGDWFGRTIWIDHPVGSIGTFSLPMIIDSIPTAQITNDKALAELNGADLFYWTPPNSVLTQIKKPDNKLVKQQIDRMIPKDIQRLLIKDSKVALDPALLIHIKHRNVAWSTYGESFITPAKQALAFKKAVENLDFQVMSSLISRITVVMVGSSDPNSPYSKADVALARTSMMQSFFNDAGPNMTIIWEGDDVKVTQVSAHEDMLNLSDRHNLADGKVKMALGVPDALLNGSSNDAKAAGWAAMIGASSELEELQTNFAGGWETIGERIAFENGYEDVDLTFEFDKSLLVDKAEERNQNRNDYIAGGLTIYDWILGQGRDPEAAFQRKCMERGMDPQTTTWEVAFMPPQGLPGQGAPVPGDPNAPVDPNAPGTPGAPAAPQGTGPGKAPGKGRTPDSVKGKPAKPPVPKNTPAG